MSRALDDEQLQGRVREIDSVNDRDALGLWASLLQHPLLPKADGSVGALTLVEHSCSVDGMQLRRGPWTASGISIYWTASGVGVVDGTAKALNKA